MNDQPRLLTAEHELIATQGLADVLAKRAEQIIRYRHTLEADAERPIYGFALDVEQTGRAVRDDAQFRADLAIMRRHAVKLAALAIALVDRIDAEAIKRAAA